jgi:hypothetical protein
MMNTDGARAGGEGMMGILSPAKPKKTKQADDLRDVAGPTSPDPVFSGEEKPLNIEVPEGWKIGES